jgi:hypothetical protein
MARNRVFMALAHISVLKSGRKGDRLPAPDRAEYSLEPTGISTFTRNSLQRACQTSGILYLLPFALMKHWVPSYSRRGAILMRACSMNLIRSSPSHM